ncbi:dTDP-4-dehydrorhamnose 3,5-epimerase [Algibacter sp.]|nr:dTDP-4-dehydrorhamnose 3,5-epimerase [Algibacter sp.]
MNVNETILEGCFVIQPKVIQDKRGYFLESFNQALFKEGLKRDINFVQDNESYSSKGVLRGLHYQKGAYAQAKLVRVIKGKILDVVVDLRTDSPTFSKHMSIELSEDNKTQLFIPRGFAHGFLVLSDTAIFSYKCDNFYNKASEGGVIYNDKDLNIDWKLDEKEFIISEKDLELPTLKKVVL